MTKDYRPGVTEFLLRHADSDSISFHMPGHKGSDFYRKHGYGRFCDEFMDCDITEITGADNLFACNGVLGESAELYRDIYDVRKSYLLVNGTSGGIIASILASVPTGGKLLMARNCHKSVYNALKLGGISPAYVYPTVVDDYGISGPVDPADVAAGFAANPDAAAFVLPSPNYYGICSDIASIAKVCHDLGKILVVDQAHGAHLKMMEDVGAEMPAASDLCGAPSAALPLSAETAGADLIINSTHKTLASFTQSAVLNVNSDRVDLVELEDKLQMIESSSPSYLLMASLDINAQIIGAEGVALFDAWLDAVDYFYSCAWDIPGLKTMDVPGYLDRTKLNLDMSALGLDGAALEQELLARGIFVELTTGNLLMCMTGIGTTREHIDRLLVALADIADEHGGASGIDDLESIEALGDGDVHGAALHEGQRLVEAWNKKREVYQTSGKWELLALGECEGRIAAASIIPYPPGIPLICPGEMIEADDIEYLKTLIDGGRDVIGVSGGKVRVDR